MPEPLLGWIRPQDRNAAQRRAHLRAALCMGLFPQDLTVPTGPVKVMLTDYWKAPDVVADCGIEFTGFHQLTGSCVGASTGNALFTLSAVQRCLADKPTKAFIPWWLYSYGRTRLNEGDRGQGEGAVDSVAGTTLHSEGAMDLTTPGLPAYSTDDGFYLTAALEMKWSDGAGPAAALTEAGKEHTVGSVAPLSSTNDIKAAILNGYPVLDGCNNYVGHGTIKGSGENAYVTGRYDGRGGHSTCILGYWDHPTDGPLYLYSNQWPTQTYPRDPAGAGRCCVWINEAEMAKLFSNGGNDGETMALSHLAYFPAQPKVLSWDFSK